MAAGCVQNQVSLCCSLVQLCTLIAFAVSSTSFSWSLAASKGCEVSDNNIHPLKSICDRLADKESTFRSTTER